MRWNGSEWKFAFEWTHTDTNQYQLKGVGVEYERLSGNAMVVYAENNSNPKWSYWNGTSWSTPASVFSSAPGSTVRTIEMASRPGTNEIAMVYYDSANDIHAIIWDGTQWDESNTEVTLTTSGRHLWNRCFDVEYESISGDLLVTWGSTSNQGFYYRTKQADTTTWSSTSTYTYSNDNKPLMVEMVPDPNSDKIFTVSENEDRHINAAIWTGEAYTDGKRTESTLGMAKPLMAIFI